jgi:hypothetical protein
MCSRSRLKNAGGGEEKVLNKKNDFLASTNFVLLSQIRGNSVIYMFLFSCCISV